MLDVRGASPGLHSEMTDGASALWCGVIIEPSWGRWGLSTCAVISSRVGSVSLDLRTGFPGVGASRSQSRLLHPFWVG